MYAFALYVSAHDKIVHFHYVLYVHALYVYVLYIHELYVRTYMHCMYVHAQYVHVRYVHTLCVHVLNNMSVIQWTINKVNGNLSMIEYQNTYVRSFLKTFKNEKGCRDDKSKK